MRPAPKSTSLLLPRFGWLAMLLFSVSESLAEGPPTIFRWANQAPAEPVNKRDEPLASDRPDFTEASSTVGQGLLQIEMGYTFIENDDAGVHTSGHSYPEALFRLGAFADWCEFRLQYNNGNQVISPGVAPQITNNGAEDLYVGMKLALTEQDGWLPEMALMPQMTLPTGSDDFSTDATLPGVNWLYGWDVTEFISTAGSTQINKAIDPSGNSYYEFAQSWTIGYTLMEHVSAYTEVFGLMPSGAMGVLPEYYFDGGFVFPITNDLQFDIRAGVGLNDPADDYFVGSGMVVRF